jgi:hypothetical protein
VAECSIGSSEQCPARRTRVRRTVHRVHLGTPAVQRLVVLEPRQICQHAAKLKSLFKFSGGKPEHQSAVTTFELFLLEVLWSIGR